MSDVQYYSVYEPETRAPDPAARADALAFVKEGFSWAALVFGMFWLIYHRMWLELVAYVAVFGALEWALTTNKQAESLLGIAVFGLTILFAWEANDLRSAMLKRRGYRLAGVAIGRDRSEAELSFFRSWLPRLEREAPAEAPAPYHAPVGGAPKPLLRDRGGDDVIGLFPNA